MQRMKVGIQATVIKHTSLNNTLFGVSLISRAANQFSFKNLSYMMMKSPVYICRSYNLSEYEANNCFCHVSLDEKRLFYPTTLSNLISQSNVCTI